jgi:hypothetical protein
MPHFEVDVLLNQGLDESTRRFLQSVQASANRVIRFDGDDRSVRLTVDVAGMTRDEAIRAAAGEVSRIFPASSDEKYLEIRQR